MAQDRRNEEVPVALPAQTNLQTNTLPPSEPVLEPVLEPVSTVQIGPVTQQQQSGMSGGAGPTPISVPHSQGGAIKAEQVTKGQEYANASNGAYTWEGAEGEAKGFLKKVATNENLFEVAPNNRVTASRVLDKAEVEAFLKALIALNPNQPLRIDNYTPAERGFIEALKLAKPAEYGRVALGIPKAPSQNTPAPNPVSPVQTQTPPNPAPQSTNPAPVVPQQTGTPVPNPGLVPPLVVVPPPQTPEVQQPITQEPANISTPGQDPQQQTRPVMVMPASATAPKPQQQKPISLAASLNANTGSQRPGGFGSDQQQKSQMTKDATRRRASSLPRSTKKPKSGQNAPTQATTQPKNDDLTKKSTLTPVQTTPNPFK